MADPRLFQKPYVLMQVFDDDDDDDDIAHQPLVRVGLSSFQHFGNHVLLCSALLCSVHVLLLIMKLSNLNRNIELEQVQSQANSPTKSLFLLRTLKNRLSRFSFT